MNLEAGSYSGSGDWNDPISGKGGVLEGGVTWEPSAGVPAFKFDSNDERIKIPDIQIGPSVYQGKCKCTMCFSLPWIFDRAYLHFSSHPAELTMTAWVYMHSFDNNCWVVNQEIWGGWNRAILIDDGRCGGGKLGAGKGGGCGNSNLSVTQPSILGKWAHVAATFKHGEFSYTFLDVSSLIVLCLCFISRCLHEPCIIKSFIPKSWLQLNINHVVIVHAPAGSQKQQPRSTNTC